MSERNLLVRNTRFLRLWVGQLLSQGGIRMYQIAIMWWILSQYGANGGKTAGLFLVMTALPSLLFVKWIGRVVDTWSSLRLLVSMDLAASTTITGLALVFHFSQPALGLILICGLLLASFQGFFDPGLNKAVPDLVDRADLDTAAAFIASTQSVASFSGAVLGGMLIDHLGIKGVLCLTALCYLVSAFCNIGILSVHSEPRSAEGGMTTGWSVLDDFPGLKKVLMGFGMVNFFTMPTLIILTLYVKEALKGTATLLGVMEACLWAGFVAGSFAAAWVPGGRKTLGVGTACIFMFGISLVVPGLIVNTFIYGFFLFVAGMVMGINNVKFMTLFQEIVPSAIKGRFFALMQALISFATPIAYFLFGVLGDLQGPVRSSLIQGTGVLVLASYFYHLKRSDVLKPVRKPLRLVPRPAESSREFYDESV